MTVSKPTFTSAQFDALVPTLKGQLSSALAKELSDCALPELGSDPNSDLWDLPTVDSKTVCKLSPVVKALVGRRLEPTWIRKGGYDSIDEAVQHLIDQLRKHCVASSTSADVAQVA